MTDGQNRCVICGGAVGTDGFTLAPGARLTTAPKRSQDVEDDAVSQLSPVERFEQAIERRNGLVRDRRVAEKGGRRINDRPLKALAD